MNRELPIETEADDIICMEELAFHITKYLFPEKNPTQLQVLCLVSKSWQESFSLVRAQLRYDNLIQECRAEEWLYHKVTYVPPDCDEPHIPPQGTLKFYRSRVNDACHEAMKDPAARDPSTTSPDHHYRAHREYPRCIELVPPRSLIWKQNSPIHFVNEVQWDKRPRLVNKFWASATADDKGGSSTMPRGNINLGFHEIVSVKDDIYAKCNPRPENGKSGDDATRLIRNCETPTDSPRWVKFCHVVREDRCRMFLNKHLLPMMGSRPSGNNWSSDRANTS